MAQDAFLLELESTLCLNSVQLRVVLISSLVEEMLSLEIVILSVTMMALLLLPLERALGMGFYLKAVNLHLL